MNILALDLGTKTGWAYNRGEVFVAGTYTLAKPKEISAWGKSRLTRRKDPRIERLCEWLESLESFDAIVIEDVQFGSTTFQAHLWAGLRSAVWLCGKSRHFDAIPVGTLKKYATGSGAADKAAMSKALKRRHPALWTPDLDDNSIDAIWLCEMGGKRIYRD